MGENYNLNLYELPPGKQATQKTFKVLKGGELYEEVHEVYYEDDLQYTDPANGKEYLIKGKLRTIRVLSSDKILSDKEKLEDLENRISALETEK